MKPCIRKLLLGPYDKRVMNNTHRADFAECLIKLALGEQWQLTWQQGWDWAPWDLESKSGVRLEVKQAAARQSWDLAKAKAPRRTPRFDIAPRSGYWPRDGSPWKDHPGRHADIYVFAWHGEAETESCDQRIAEQWIFYVVAEHALPENQKSIGLTALEKLAEPRRFGELERAVSLACPSPEEQKAFLSDRSTKSATA